MEKALGTGAGRWLRWLLPGVFVLVIFASYSNTFTSPPFLDDFHSFIAEKSMYIDKLSLSNILALFHTKFGLTRSIPVITFALNHKLGNSNLIYFHLVNIVIHVLAFLSAYFLARQVISVENKRRPGAISDTLAGWLPICIAALWALNPVQTNAVTYLVQRMASLQALFYFLAIGCYCKARMCSPEQVRKAAAWFVGCALATLGSLLSKENSFILPVTFALTEVWFFESALIKKTWQRFRTAGWKLWLPVIIFGAVFAIYAFDNLYSRIVSGYANRSFTMSERLLTESRIVIWYISLLLWPDPGRMSMEHYVDISTSLFSPPTTLLSILAIGGLLAGSIRLRRKYPLVTFGIIWFFLNLVSESTILPLELVFEHRLYLPSFGIFLSVAVLLARGLRSCARKLPEIEYVKLFCSTVVLLACASALLTFLRNEDWQTTISIQYDGVVKSPELPRTNANFANALLQIGQYEEALKYGELALEKCRPRLESYAVATNAVVAALSNMGRFDEAFERGEKLLADYPKGMDGDSLPLLCLNLAQAYMIKEREADAFRMIEKAYKLIPLLDNSVHRKGPVIAELTKLLMVSRAKNTDLDGDGQADPGDVSINLWIVLQVEKWGDNSYAGELLEREYARNPDDTQLAGAVRKFREEAAQNMAQKQRWNFAQKYVNKPFSRFNICMAVAFLVQERQGMPDLLLRIGAKCKDWALEMRPDSPDALLLAGWYAYNGDRSEEAVSLARKSLEYDPQSAKNWLGLGFFLAKAGQPLEAADAFTRVIELYPGYSQREVLKNSCEQLRKGEPIESITGYDGNSSMKAGLKPVPAS